jgi:TPR repeat protein
MKSLLLLVALVSVAHADKFPASGPCEDADACEKACKANQKGTCYWGGVLLMQKAVGDDWQGRALALFDKACTKGDAEACWQSANLTWHHDSRTLKASGPNTFAAFQKACNKNHARACMRLADIAAAAEGDAKKQKLAATSKAKGVKLLEAKCMKAKMARACTWAAGMYEAGDGVKQDAKKAAALRDKRCVIETGFACPPPAAAAGDDTLPMNRGEPGTKPAIIQRKQPVRPKPVEKPDMDAPMVR